MFFGKLRVSITTFALLFPIACMASDNGELNIDNRCADYLTVEQTNARCSPNATADANKKTYLSPLMFFKTSIPGNETVYCTYNIKLGKSGTFIGYAGYDRRTVAINKICKPNRGSCTCDDAK